MEARFGRVAAALTLAAVLLGAALAPPGPARAQTPALQGTYTLDKSASQDIAKAVDKAVAPLGFLAAPVARRRLMDSNQPSDGLTIALAGRNATIRTSDGVSITSPTDGTPVDWKRSNTETVKVTTVWEGAKLKRSLANADGARVNVYGLDPAGSALTLDVVVTAAQLPAPLTYRLVYRRGR